MGEIVLVDKDGKQYTEEKVHDYNLPMYVVTLLSYKDFAFKQSAAGLWGENILSLCQPNSISQFKASHQTLDQQILKLSGLNAQYYSAIWCTLVGIKVLMSDFAADKAKWKLIVQKART
jgi:hypothetical protein